MIWLAVILAIFLSISGIVLFRRGGALRIVGIILIGSAALMLAMELAMFAFVGSMPQR